MFEGGTAARHLSDCNCLTLRNISASRRATAARWLLSQSGRRYGLAKKRGAARRVAGPRSTERCASRQKRSWGCARGLGGLAVFALGIAARGGAHNSSRQVRNRCAAQGPKFSFAHNGVPGGDFLQLGVVSSPSGAAAGDLGQAIPRRIVDDRLLDRRRGAAASKSYRRTPHSWLPRNPCYRGTRPPRCRCRTSSGRWTSQSRSPSSRRSR